MAAVRRARVTNKTESERAGVERAESLGLADQNLVARESLLSYPNPGCGLIRNTQD